MGAILSVSRPVILPARTDLKSANICTTLRDVVSMLPPTLVTMSSSLAPVTLKMPLVRPTAQLFLPVHCARPLRAPLSMDRVPPSLSLSPGHLQCPLAVFLDPGLRPHRLAVLPALQVLRDLLPLLLLRLVPQ
jgi:hypothetical protein